MEKILYCKTGLDFVYQVSQKKKNIENQLYESWGIVIKRGKDNKVFYQEDDISISMEVVVILINILAENQVEPEQAGYIIEDFISKIYSFELK